MKHTALAALIVATAVVHNHAHRFGVDDDANGAIYIVTASAQALVLLAIIAAVFAAQALVCNAAWLVLRWDVAPGTPSCTDSHWPWITGVSLIATGVVAQFIVERRHG